MGMETSKEQAYRRGRALLKRMKGKGWKLYVHENLGWFYSVYNGNLSVSPGYDNKPPYSCLLSDTDKYRFIGSYIWIDPYHSKDPNKVVEHQLRTARTEVNKLDAIVKDLEAKVGKPKKVKTGKCRTCNGIGEVQNFISCRITECPVCEGKGSVEI